MRPTPGTRSFPALLGLTALLLSAPALAEVDLQTKMKAEEHAQAADSARAKGNFDAALRELEAAAALDPQGKYLAKIGTLYKEQNQPNKALEAYKKALELGGLKSPGKLKALIDTLEAQLAGVTVAIASTPPGAGIFVDDEKDARGTAPTRITLKPGAHFVTLRLDGHQDASKAITVQAGKEAAVSFELKAGGNAAAPPAATTPEAQPESQVTETAPEPKSGGSNLLAWSLVGVGGATLIAGGAFSFLTLQAQDDVDQAEKDALVDKQGLSGVRDAEDTRDSRATTSYVLYGLGAAITGVGAYLLLTADDGGAQAGATITPEGFVLSGRF